MESCEGKLRRADAHLNLLRDEISVAARHHNHRITVEDDPNTSEYVFKVYDVPPVDPEWGFIVGDCLHNLRCTLDHLVYQLAILCQSRALTPEEESKCMFPIFNNTEKFHSVKKLRIGMLRPGDQTVIEQLQPFNALEPSIWPLGPTPAHAAFIPTFLGTLDAFENVDKHREVHPTWHCVSWFDALSREPPIPVRGHSTTTEALKDGAEIGRWAYIAPRPELPADMDMDRYFPIDVALGDPSNPQDAAITLRVIRDAVRDVLEIFRPCIERGLPALPLSTS